MESKSKMTVEDFDPEIKMRHALDVSRAQIPGVHVFEDAREVARFFFDPRCNDPLADLAKAAQRAKQYAALPALVEACKAARRELCSRNLPDDAALDATYHTIDDALAAAGVED